MKKFYYFNFLIILLLLFVTGCNNFNSTTKYVNNNENGVNISEITTKIGNIPDTINIIGVKDENNFYCFKGNNRKEIYLYHVPDGSTSILNTVISKDKFIKACTFSENWIVWVEDQVEVEEDNKVNELNWVTYARNLRTGSLFEIDKYKNINLDSSTFFRALEPRVLSIDGDNVVYTNYDLSDDSLPIQTIKLFNLSTKEMRIIDLTKNYQNQFYSNPVISGKYITWSQSKVDLSDYTEKGNTYIYNLEINEKQKITETDDILWPNISEEYIVARKKPNGLNDNSSILSYDKKTNTWNTIVSPNSSFYKDKAHVEMGMNILSDHYLIWRDNVNSNIIVYDLSNKKFYIIASKNGNNEKAIPIGLYNKILFWVEDNTENPQKQLTKYAILK